MLGLLVRTGFLTVGLGVLRPDSCPARARVAELKRAGPRTRAAGMLMAIRTGPVKEWAGKGGRQRHPARAKPGQTEPLHINAIIICGILPPGTRPVLVPKTLNRHRQGR